MSPSEYFPNPQQDAEYTIQLLNECREGQHPRGNGITDTAGSAQFIGKKLLEDCPGEIEPETREALLAAANLRVDRRGRIRYGTLR